MQVVGCIVEHEGKVLLCRRAIEPCKGLWTVPAGFLEMGESTAAGAARETWEEAKAAVEVCSSLDTLPTLFSLRPREINGIRACAADLQGNQQHAAVESQISTALQAHRHISKNCVAQSFLKDGKIFRQLQAE